jgi:maltose-binding protein MalE
MRRYPKSVVLCAAVVATSISLLSASCSSASDETAEPTDTAQADSSTTEPAPLPAEQTPPDAVEVSPDGVTTKVDVPSDATESQYGQACHAAKVWFDGQQADPKTQVETYLKSLQAPDAIGPGSFDTPWAQLTPAQQAGVIMAANGAANGDCE